MALDARAHAPGQRRGLPPRNPRSNLRVLILRYWGVDAARQHDVSAHIQLVASERGGIRMTEPGQADFDRQLRDATDRLVAEFGSQMPAPVIEQSTREALAAYDGARIRTYLPILAYRRARESLRERSRGGL